MKKTGVRFRLLSFLAATAVGAFVMTNTAEAQASPVAGKLGLGIATAFSPGPGPDTGLNLVFDGGMWHADAIAALSGNGASTASLGAHGWFHVREGAMSDFSVGGGLGWFRYNPEGPGEGASGVGIDIGFMIRAFVTANVAVGATGGLQVLSGDFDGFSLSGQPVGAFSFTYFF
ncbi:MAG TPA: hypothetical protein VGG33_16085 [Polyangia bacterium]